MLCTECQKNNRRELKTEMMIHHANFRSGKADVFVFPTAWVCLDCGSIELLALRDGDIEAGARTSSTARFG
jgi:hypothetical protein